MKKVVLVILVGLTAIMILSAGCTSKPAPAPVQNVTGILKDINTPAEPGKDAVIVQTPKGQETFTLTPETKYIINGEACPLDKLGKTVESGNWSYNCTIVLNDEYEAVSVYVFIP